MKKILKKLGVFALTLLLATTVSCDLDGDLTNPNEVSVAQSDPDLLLNAIQLDFADFYSIASGNTVFNDRTTVGVDRLMRMRAMITGYTYQSAFLPQYLNDMWTLGYQKVLVNVETVIPLAEEKNFTTHIAVAKILKAYTYLTLVDLFGNVPQTQALLGLTEFNPKADSGADIYAAAIGLLGEARIELAKKGSDAGAELARDIYYGGDRAKWTALANTLELKAWVNLSMVPSRQAEANGKIDTFIDVTDGSVKTGIDLIDTEEENFTYKYGTASVPVSRHPMYRQFYGPTRGSATGYVCNNFLWELYAGMGVEDPRWRYYFYRQVGSIVRAKQVDANSIDCSPAAKPPHYANGGYVFCTFEPGFYGRDHGNAAGTPPDTQVITCAGAYPAGGRVDNTPTSVSTYYGATIQGDGGDGAGIEPIFMSFFTGYLTAEVMARRGSVAPAKAKLAAAVNQSIDQVRSFSNSLGQTLSGGLEPSTVAYLSRVDARFDAATTPADRVKVIGRELYVACWGSAIEAYNSYRRTGAPTRMQPTLQVGAGRFLRSLVYPSNYVNLNNTADQKDFDTPENYEKTKVFWDTYPDELN